MNNVTVFNNEAFGALRTIERDGEIWFVGKEVAEMLGYERARDAISAHVNDEDKTIIKGGDLPLLKVPNRGLTIINESGLYSLIFSSKLPKAREFKH